MQQAGCAPGLLDDVRDVDGGERPAPVAPHVSGRLQYDDAQANRRCPRVHSPLLRRKAVEAISDCRGQRRASSPPLLWPRTLAVAIPPAEGGHEDVDRLFAAADDPATAAGISWSGDVPLRGGRP
jgi:hypothetical protein